jgi:hypothetical protein
MIFLFDFIINYPQALIERKNLEGEIAQLDHPSDAILEKKGSSNQTSYASAFEEYYTYWDFNQVFNYYYKVLIENGWNYIKTSNKTSMPIEQTYCKYENTAKLSYYKTGYKWTYSIDLLWGHLSECNNNVIQKLRYS